MQKPLQNYLRAYRKRSGLTIAEVAYLIGSEHGITVSRHERGERSLDLDTALAYRFILGAGLRQLFEGQAAEVEAAVQERAKTLAASLREVGRRKRAVELLEQLAKGASDNHL